MSYGIRSVAGELTKLIDKKVIVRLVDGKSYSGKLISFDPTSLHIVLGDAESSDGLRLHRVIISGSRVSELLVQEQPIFNAEEFASLVISKLGLRPDVVKVLSDTNSVIIYDRIKVTEAGVEGTGSFAQRIYEIYTEYIESKKRGGR
ncbi:Like-Sm ribonucleoprotein core [Ignisphaera aggregans DSM 17230]|uniref:Like-Sm ribonucleoprotein core n=1 Tax=Ignisphaera aggregans (strain DSM 17230 / JCM 13409 / AQ1.S1) TaxID=583356 RepID=E0SPS7_IGNAA|nr:Like-Sm ribonucleoprotein core [Ignisphaera aggregans DSM 17230]